MAVQMITVGRSLNSDIYLDERFVYASIHHGIISYDGNQLMYTDRSTNGTMINNHKVKHGTVPLRRGDIILVAGRYLLDWNMIDAYLPKRAMGTAMAPASGWKQYNSTTAINTNQWNWGAMGLYPLWGLQNGCVWALPVAIVIGVLLFPLPNVVFGFYGSKWAWQGRTWASPHQFYSVQQQWANAGIVAMCCETVVYLWVVCLLLIKVF